MKKRISVIIPVLNETERINGTLDRLFSRQPQEHLEVIVVDGCHTANTINAITRKGVVRLVSPKGRGCQMNVGSLSARGDILLFLHADTRLPDHAVSDIIKIMADDTIAGGAFDLGIDSPRISYRLIERAASLRSRITRLPYGDQSIFIKKTIFEETGGYKEIPVMEDVEFMRRIKRFGYKIRIINKRVQTSSRRWDEEGPVLCTLRNWLILVLYLAGVEPIRFRRMYRYK